MTERICPVCANICFYRLTKKVTKYFQCSNCAMVYSDPIDQENMVGGGAEVPRNEQQNHLRIERLNAIFKGKEKPLIEVLDFGCGHGMLVSDLRNEGYDAVGYDAYNPEFSKLPPNNYFDAITCIEVIEHCSYPFAEIEVMHRSLKKYGVVIFETSFTDVASQENISLEDFTYLEPSVGHSTLFSHHSLDLLMVGRGFKVGRHFNRHVRIYYKA